MALIPQQADGIAIVDDWAGFGQRTTASGTVAIDNVYVPADCVVGQNGVFNQFHTLGSRGQLLHAAVDLGIARAAFADMVEFIRTKSRANTSLGIETAPNDPLTIAREGTVAVKIEAASAALERAGRKVDIAQIDPSQEAYTQASLGVAAAKVLTTEAALEAAMHYLNYQAHPRRMNASKSIGTGAMPEPIPCTIRFAGSTTPSAIII